MRYAADTIHKIVEKQEYININLEQFHRSASAIYPDSTIFAVPEKDEQAIIFTTINPESWDDIWKLDVHMKDLPGALSSCLSFLKRNRINVLHHECSSEKFGSQEVKTFHASFILDFKGYNNPIDKDRNNRNSVTLPNLIPFGLKSALGLQCGKFLIAKKNRSDWQINIERMGYFFGHKEIRGNKKDYVWNEYGIRISNHDFNEFVENVDLNSDDLSYYAHSDTENKYIKVFFLGDESNPVLSLRVEHNEQVGVIEEICEVLRLKKVNIVSSYNRLKRMGYTAFWNGLIECKSEKRLIDSLSLLSTLPDIDKVLVKEMHNIDRSKIRQRCKTNEKLKLLKPKIPFDEEQSGKQKTTQVERSDKSEQRLRVNPIYRKKNYTYNAKQVFVAMPFQKDFMKMYDEVWSPVCSEFGYSTCRSNLAPLKYDDELLPDRIKRLIVESGIIFADISAANPNVLYEIGIAHTLGRRVILFCDTKKMIRAKLPFDIDSYEYIPYDIKNLKKARENLRTELSTPRRMNLPPTP